MKNHPPPQNRSGYPWPGRPSGWILQNQPLRWVLALGALIMIWQAGSTSSRGQAVASAQLIRNFTPLSWEARVVEWNRDLNPRNRIDDTIDATSEGLYDVIVNYNRCVEDQDIEKLEGISADSKVQLRSKYISSVFVGNLTKEEIETLAQEPGVAFIEEQHEMELHLNVSLPNICVTPGPCSPNTVQEQFPGITGAGVNIAIIDSGVDNVGHDTFSGTTFVGGYNVVTSTFEDPDDLIFHGTHVASIALGQGGLNVSRGMAPGAGLIDVKVSDTPTFPPTRICDALETVYDNRVTWSVDVINMSLGSSVSSDGTDALSQLVDLAESMGIVVVVSAGNYGPGNVGLGAPGAATRAITVAASETMNTAARGDDGIACFSSRGPRANDGDLDTLDELKPEVSAPGTHLDLTVPTCTLGGGTGILAARWNTANSSIRLEGTSMAAPHVAGLAALIMQGRTGINAASVKDLIVSTATPMGAASMPAVDPVWNSQSGWGLVNAFASLNLATVTDLTFPSHPASPGWLSPDITTAPFPAKVGVATTVTALVTNRGPGVALGARIHFGAHVFSAATPTFFDIGTRVVNLPVGTTPVSISWTPQAASHQCLKVEIGYGPDTDYSNNLAQRNLNVQSSPAPFMVKNTVTETRQQVRLIPTVDNPDLPGWDYSIKPDSLLLGADDCPEIVSVELFPPVNALPGTTQKIHVEAVVDTQDGPVVLGGVTVQATHEPENACLQLICPTNLIAQAYRPEGAKVDYPVDIINQCDLTGVEIVCNPPSGSLFPLGRTAVRCTASSDQQVTATCTFVVEVIQPRLSIRYEQGRVIINWTGEGVLQEAEEVTGPWRDLPDASNPLILVPAGGSRFYRLKLAPERLPLYDVTGPGVTLDQFNILAETLGLPPESFLENGHVMFTDPDAFQRIPTKSLGDPGFVDEEEQALEDEVILFDEFQNLQILEEEVALKLTEEILQAAGLITVTTPSWECTMVPAHSMFEAVNAEGREVTRAPLDTQVNFQFRLGNLPVVGPGAKIRLVFDSTEQVSQMIYSLRQVREGATVPILSQPAADQLALVHYERLMEQIEGELQLSSRLVYYAPPNELPAVQTLIPHYLYEGSFMVAGTGELIELRRFLLPAVQEPKLVPEAEILADPAGLRIFAQARVVGGTPPYDYSWSSSTTPLDPRINDMETIEYEVGPGKTDPYVEQLYLLVTDANGITAQAEASFDIKDAGLQALAPGAELQNVGGVLDVGTEWVGTSQGLNGSSGNANGFVYRFLLDRILGGSTDIRFNYGDYSAWERDFKDPSLGGDDQNWVDNVDALFYTGHANGSGWTFPGNIDDGFLHFNEARYGNNDLEWIVIAACGPLQPGTSPNRWWQRWGPAFDGLHLMCGYETVTFDNTVEGRKWADYMLRGWTVRQAWMQTGIDVQGPSETVAVMGVFGPEGISNYNDHYHGEGSVSSDIRDIRGFWKVSSPGG